MSAGPKEVMVKRIRTEGAGVKTRFSVVECRVANRRA